MAPRVGRILSSHLSLAIRRAEVRVSTTAPLPTLVTMPMADLTSDLPKAPVGTGPFKVTSFTPNVQLTVARNDNYWDKAPPFAISWPL
jgi:peptide/nickel transport system substrate-binding protein